MNITYHKNGGKLIMETPGDNWDPNLYEASHSYVWKLGSDLVHLANLEKGMSVLDLGCGTGHLTNQINLSGATVLGIDNSQSMISQAENNYPHLDFVLGDARKLTFQERFDVVFSNATLHWIKEPKSVVQGILRALKPNGKLVAEFGGEGNVKSVVKALSDQLGENMINPWYFPSVEEYTKVLTTEGLTVRSISLFDRPTSLEKDEGLRDWLNMFCKPIFATVNCESREQICKGIEKQLRSRMYQNGRWIIDYRRLRVVATKSYPISRSNFRDYV